MFSTTMKEMYAAVTKLADTSLPGKAATHSFICNANQAIDVYTDHKYTTMHLCHHYTERDGLREVNQRMGTLPSPRGRLASASS